MSNSIDFLLVISNIQSPIYCPSPQLFVENLSARKGLETHSFRGSDGSAEWG